MMKPYNSDPVTYEVQCDIKEYDVLDNALDIIVDEKYMSNKDRYQ